jgi:hypothetical protein
MRSTQFHDHFLLEDEPDESCGRRSQQHAVCETLKILGYAQDNQVSLYGEIFHLVSDPISIGQNLVLVDALHGKSGKVMRVRIPQTLVQMARIKARAA